MSTSSDVYSEEPYALIGHVRFCEGEVRAQNGAHPLYSTKSHHQGIKGAHRELVSPLGCWRTLKLTRFGRAKLTHPLTALSTGSADAEVR